MSTPTTASAPTTVLAPTTILASTTVLAPTTDLAPTTVHAPTTAFAPTPPSQLASILPCIPVLPGVLQVVAPVVTLGSDGVAIQSAN